MLRQWRFWLGLAVSLLFLWLVFRNQDLGQVRLALAGADYRYLAPAVAVYFIGVVFRTLRWRVLLSPIKVVRARTLFRFVVIGYMANNLLPARTGEFVRAYALAQREGIRKSASLATIAVERVFDGLTMILFIVIASPLIRLNQQVEGLTIVAAVLFAGLLGGLALFGAVPRLQGLLLGLARRLLPARLERRLEDMLSAFVLGLSSLRSRGDLARIVLASIAAWTCEATMYLLVAAAFDLNLIWPAALLTTATANLSTLLPSSPGYVGIFQYGVLLVLVGLLNVPEAQALSYAIVLHAALWLPVTLLGLVFWSGESLTWRDLGRLRAEPEGAGRAEPELTGSRRG